MADKDYQASKITIQSDDRWCEIEEWNKFQEQKKKIQSKYPTKPWEVSKSSGQGNKKDPYNSEWWEDWQKYKKEITDLMLDEYGNFSKFLFEIRPERADLKTRIWLRGHHNTEYKRNKK